jgi:outer membrane protein
MLRSHFLVFALLSAVPFYAQTSPPSPQKPWSGSGKAQLGAELARIPRRQATLDPNTTYTLPELVDIAERSNPKTRFVWEQAEQTAAALGIARSALLPTIAAVASASINQYSLFNGKFNHEDTALFPDSLNLTYTVLDFGARGARIDVAKANLLAANFTFNNTPRDVAFHVAEAYYRLLDALSQEEAARAALSDARTVRDAVELRFANGLATLPDALEARAAAAEAQYEFATAQGLTETARGDLATVLGASPATPFKVLDADAISVPENTDEPIRAIMDRALAQRPDLLAEAARLRATEASVKRARSAFEPVLSFSGNWGHSNAVGQQKGGPVVHSAIYPYQAQINLSWTVFDGGARKYEVNRARAEAEGVEAQMAVTRDQIENDIWSACSHLKTAQQALVAAEALLPAADRSYAATFEAFQSGVRTFIDVSSAQKTLARARATRLIARVRVLESMAELAFTAADSIPAAQH